MSLEDRIPTLSQRELGNLHDNATRLAAGPQSRQQAEAERLLPIIAAAMEAGRKARLVTAGEKKVARQKELAEARVRRAATRKAEKEASGR